MTTSNRAARAGLLGAHLDLLTEALLSYRTAEPLLARWGTDLAGILVGGGRLLVAGNGGSAAEAQHLTAELVGRLRDDRQPLSAIALHAETSALTAIGNDYGYDEVFARQVRAHGRRGDVLLLMSTSGASGNLLAAVAAAREAGLRCWAFTGPAPNPLAGACHEALAVASPDSQVVQELHLVSTHVLCEYVDRALPTALAALAGQAAAVAAGRRGGAAPAPVDAPGRPVADRSTVPADGRPVADRSVVPADGPPVRTGVEVVVDGVDPTTDGRRGGAA
ncbi:SIS domain-containing protein [Micromonospora rifamycinica]|uniref:D-sedoheptulose-7-phosphate isomerase n=1 Tax=Micromonospora rifamycinica TaxID=291594 RepID=UPI002E2D4EF6|nr:SIS domain-containing protein [Micromonospora rifamycinica]